jgi:HAD superfamily hydrolase (TIGR01549 family)
MIKAIIFDCFGVVKQDGLKNGGDTEKDRVFIIETVNKANKGLIPSTVPIFAKRLGVSDGEWWEVIQEYNAVDMELLEYVRELKRSYRTAMLSNISSGGLVKIFPGGFLQPYFELTIGSGDIGFAKPEARAYELVAEKLGVRLDECVMIDDRPDYCEGATAVGMQAIEYKNLSQLKQNLSKILELNS